MMNQQDIFKKIGQILKELTDQYQYLEKHPDEWNGFELDLFQANANFLAEHVQVFQRMNKVKAQSLLAEKGEDHQQNETDPIVEIKPVIPVLEKEIFKPDNEPSKFEFIMNDKPSVNLFDFEEKGVGEIFDRPLSPEEEQIIAQKQKLREKDSLSILPVTDEDDEIGPEPFLVSEEKNPAAEQTNVEDTAQTAADAPENIPTTLSEVELAGARAAEALSGSATPIMWGSETKDPVVNTPTPASALPESVAQHTEQEENSPVKPVVPERDKLHTPVSFQQPQGSQPALNADTVAPEKELFDEVKPSAETASVSERESAAESESFSAAKPVTESAAAKTDPATETKHEVEPPLTRAEPVAAKSESVTEAKPAAETPKMTLNDLLSSQNSRNVPGDQKRPVISDLKQAISFNDKMRYIKDLFNGYNLAYAEAIDLVNKMPDLESAHQFLERNYAIKNNWIEKQDTADQFYELLQQRFNHSGSGNS